MYGRIVKSERILTKLRVLDYEYICDRIAKFHKKILFSTRVIFNIQILTTKYFSFQYIHTAVRHSIVRKWRCVDAVNVNKWRNHVINKRRSYFNQIVNDQYYQDILLRQQLLLPAIRCVSGDFFYFSTGQCSCPQSTWDSASVNSWNTRPHHSSSVAS